MKFTVIANCQAGPLASMLSALIQDAQYSRVKQIHLLNAADRESFDSTLAAVDVVIHQPIGPSFKDFATEAVKSRFPTKQYVSFPSLFFLGYWPWMMYLRKPGGGIIKGVTGDYHDERIVGAYIDGMTVDATVAHVEGFPVADDFIEQEFSKLRSRELGLDAASVPCLEAHYRERKLFHTMNHPSNFVLLDIAQQLLRALGLSPPAEAVAGIAKRSEYLNGVVAPIDQVVRRRCAITAADDGCYSSTLEGDRRQWTLRAYIEACFANYSRHDDMAAVFSHAKQRRAALGT